MLNCAQFVSLRDFELCLVYFTEGCCIVLGLFHREMLNCAWFVSLRDVELCLVCFTEGC